MDTMHTGGDHWGHCDHCKWWQHNQDASDHQAAGRCEQPELTRFELQVTAQSGCNHYEPLTADIGQLAAAG